MVQRMNPVPVRKPALPSDKLQRVQQYVEEHLDQRLPISRLAAVVNMSPFHFARLFKQATGLAPHAYLLHRRVERAKQLLREEALPLVSVATRVGFQTQGHFTEVFRRHAGLTPRHSRLSVRERPAQAPAPQHAQPREPAAAPPVAPPAPAAPPL